MERFGAALFEGGADLGNGLDIGCFRTLFTGEGTPRRVLLLKRGERRSTYSGEEGVLLSLTSISSTRVCSRGEASDSLRLAR
jgi:hypothetical protein